MMSMLRYIDDRCLRTSVTLIYCVRTRHDVIFAQELTRLRRRLPEFRMVLILSQPDPAGNGPRGRVSCDLIATHVEDLCSATIFLCGPPPFMESVQGMLGSLAVRSDCIKRESFGYTPPGGSALTPDIAPGSSRFDGVAGVGGPPRGRGVYGCAEDQSKLWMPV